MLLKTFRQIRARKLELDKIPLIKNHYVSMTKVKLIKFHQSTMLNFISGLLPSPPINPPLLDSVRPAGAVDHSISPTFPQCIPHIAPIPLLQGISTTF